MKRRGRRSAGRRFVRPAQIAVVVLVAVIAIAGGYLIGFAATRPPASPTPTAPPPTETPTPSATATPTPSPTATPTPTPTATPTPTPTPAATPTPRPTLPPEPPTPAPTDNLTAASGTGVIQFLGVRLDDQTGPGHRVRVFSFTADRAGDVSASISGTKGGTIELCLTPAAPNGTPAPDLRSQNFCDDLTQGSKRQRTPARRQDWTVMLRASESGQRPTTNLLLRFPSASPSVRLIDFRFQGTEVADYNGFTARIVTDEAGTLRIAGSWVDDDGESTHDYGVSVFDVTEGSRPVYRTAGTASNTDVRTIVRGKRKFEVRLENRDAYVPSRVTLAATLSWP
jgi:hypothetical protein